MKKEKKMKEHEKYGFCDFLFVVESFSETIVIFNIFL